MIYARPSAGLEYFSHPSRRTAIIWASATLIAVLSFRAEAANPVWNGAGSVTNNNFSNTNNWVSGTAPVNNSINGRPVTFDVLATGATNTANVDSGGNSAIWTFNAAATNMFVTMNGQQMGAANGPDVFINNSPNLQTIHGNFSLFDIGGTTTTRRFNAANGPLIITNTTMGIRGDASPTAWALELAGSHNGTLNCGLVNVSLTGKTLNLIKNGTGTWELKQGFPNVANAASLAVNAGNLLLDAADTFSGTTRIVGGTLVLNNAGALQNSLLDMNAADAGLIQFSNAINAATLGGLQGSRNITLTNNAGNAVNLSVGNNNSSTTYSGILGDAGTGAGLTKVGSGTLTLSTPVAFTGPIKVNGGSLAVSSLTGIQTVPGVTVASGGSLQANAAGTYPGTPITITGTGSGGASQGALDFHSGNATASTWPGAVTLNGAATIGSYGVTLRTTFSSPISGTGNLTIQAQGGNASSHTAAFTLGAAGAYSGTTTLKENGGLLWLAVSNGVANALPPATALTLASGGKVCDYDLNGFSQALGGLSSALTGAGTAKLINSSATPAALAITDAASTTYAGNLGASGANNFSLLKSGAGTLTLSGANTYSGGTTISGGTLQAASLGSGDVAVGAGAGLGAGAAGSVATLALAGNLTLNSSVLYFDITNNTGNADLITVAGNLTPGGVTTIALSNVAPLTDGDYPLIQVTGSLNGTAANFSVANAFGQTYSIVVQPGSPNVVLLRVATTIVLGKTWAGDGSANLWDINTSLNWLATSGGAGTYVYHDGDLVTLDDSSTNLTVNLNTTVQPGSVTVNDPTKSYLIQGPGKISGATGLAKQGAGTLVLANTTANDYTGLTRLGGGTLQIGNGAAAGSLGASDVSVTAAGTTLAFNRSDAITVNNAITNGGGNPSLVINSGSVTLGGSVDNAGAGATVNHGATLILAKASSATAHALGAASTINTGGTLQLGGTGGDQIYAGDTITLAGGAFDLAGLTESFTSLNGYGLLTNSTGSGTLTLTGNSIFGGGALTMQSGTLQLNGAAPPASGVSGGGTFNQTGGTVNSGTYFENGLAGGGTASLNLSGGSFVNTGELLNGFATNGNLTVSGTASLTLNLLSWGDGPSHAVSMALNGGSIALNYFNKRAGGSPLSVSFNGSLLQGASTQAGFLSADPTVTATVSTGGARFDSQGYNLTISAPLLHDPALGVTPDGGVTKAAGTGALALTGANTYTGPTIVSNGVLNTTTASLGAGSYSVSDGATLGVTAANPGQSLAMSSLTLGSVSGPATNNFNLGAVSPTAAVITNTGALTLNGPVTVNVTGTNLNPGTIVLIAYGSGGSGTFVAGSLPVQPGYTFILTNDTSARQLQLVATTTIPPLRWAVGAGTWDTTTPNWQLLFGGGAATYAETDPVTFDDTNTGSSPITVTLDTTHTPGNITVNSTKNYVIGGGALAGPATLTKSGPSTLTLSGANTFSGGTTINGGVVTLNSSSGPALAGAVTVNTNGTLQSSAPGSQFASGVTVTLAGGAFDLAGATESFTALNGYGLMTDSVGGGALTASAACTVSGGTLNFQGGALTTPAGIASFTVNNAATFLQTGGAVNVINGYVQVAGQLTIAGGIFNCSLELMPGFTTAGVVTVNGGTLNSYLLRAGGAGNGTFYLNRGGAILTDQIYSSGSVGLFYFNGGTLGISTFNPGRTPADWIYSLTHAYVSTNGAVIDTSNNGGHVYSISQPLESDPALGATADGGLTKLGAGTLTLTNANTYTGPTLVNGGTLSLGGVGSIAGSALIGVTNGATFDVSGLGATFTLGSGQILSNSAASTGNLNGSLNTGAGILALSYDGTGNTPALNLAGGTLTLSASTSFVIDNTGAPLANGVYELISVAGNGAAIAGSLSGSVTVTDGGAAGPASLQINGGQLYLVVGTFAPTFSSQPVSLTRYAGGTAIFTAAVQGSPAPTLLWEHNGSPVIGVVATNQTLVLPNLQPGDAGNYVLTATNVLGGTNSDTSVTLTVLPSNTSPYLSAILGYQPFGSWRFNEGESTIGYDYVGGNNVVDPNAGPLGNGPQPPMFPGFETTNTAPVLNGSSQGYASTVSLFNHRSTFTLMGWFNLSVFPVPTDPFNNPQGRASLFGQRSAAELGFYEGTNLYFYATGISHTIFATNTFVTGQWHYVAVVSDPAAGTTTLYLDGAVAGSASSVPGTTSPDLFSIGKNVAYPTSLESGFDTAFFPGSLDEVTAYDHALSAAAIQALYQTGTSQAGVAPTNVVANVVNLGGVNSLVITGGGGSGSGYTVLTSTNLSTPLANWTVTATGLAFGAGGTVSFTNAISPANHQLFYRLRVP